MRRLPSHRRRAFAAILAITLILLVGATLAAVAAAFSADARRTRTLGSDAQLRQLLTAGAIAAAEQLKAAGGDVPTGEKAIPLPADLGDRGASLKVSAAREGDAVTVVVDATLATRHARQTVRFTQRDGRWTPTAAELN